MIDTDGMEALTIGRLAKDMGVRPMALYTHFRDKEAIVKAAAAEIFGRFEVPEPATSDLESLRKILHAYFRLLIDNPVLLQLYEAGEDVTPAAAHFSEAIFGRLLGLGLDHRAVVGWATTLVRFVIGSAFVYPTRRTWENDSGYFERTRLRLAALPTDTYPAIHELTRNYPTFTQQESFEFGLGALLAALGAITNAPADSA